MQREQLLFWVQLAKLSKDASTAFRNDFCALCCSQSAATCNASQKEFTVQASVLEQCKANMAINRTQALMASNLILKQQLTSFFSENSVKSYDHSDWRLCRDSVDLEILSNWSSRGAIPIALYAVGSVWRDSPSATWKFDDTIVMTKLTKHLKLSIASQSLKCQEDSKCVRMLPSHSASG